jgi:hypothetical protein
VRNRHLVRNRLAAGLTAGLAALLLAGCGGDDSSSGDAAASSSSAASSESERTGPEVAADAADALEEAGAVHVAGTLGTGAEAQGVDLFLQGDDATGTITIGGQTVQLLTVGGVSYFQGSADFWAGFGAPAQAAAQLDGVWVIVPAEEAASFGELSLTGLVQELRSPSDGPVEDGVDTDELDGEEVLVVTQADGSALYVAAEDPTYPLRIVNTGDDAGTLDFSQFGESQEITAPEAPLDLGQLGA